jgi:two-component system, NarL family, sensor histidine kinase YdfH
MESKATFPTSKKQLQEYLKGIQPVWPFFALLTLAMVVIYALTVANAPAVSQPVALLCFTLLMLLHLVLHWMSPLVAASRKLGALYLIIQVLLIMGLVLFTKYETLVYGLFIGIMGETLGIIRPLKRSLVIIVALLAMMFVTHGLLFGWTSVLPFVITILPLTFFVVIYVYLYTNLLMEKKKAEDLLEDLEIAHEQLREYTLRIEQLTLANERERMARELHDTLSQGVAGIVLQLEAASEHLQKGRNDRAGEIVKQTITHARSTLSEARQVIDDLRQQNPAAGSLEEILHAEANEFLSSTGILCETTVANDLSPTNEMMQHLKKIVSEGLTNIRRHANAKRCWIKLENVGENVRLEIGDDGRGFDRDQAEITNGHYGLKGMQERTKLLGGEMKVESSPEQGTCLRFTFPVKR